MVKHVYIVRHGERVDHVDPQWHRTATHPADPPLTDRGLQQAAEVGAFLTNAPLRPTAVYASPFFRTLQTASAIAAALDLRVRPEYGLMEWLNADWFGDFNDFPKALLLPTHETYPKLLAKIQDSAPPLHPLCSTPETHADVFSRCKATADEAKRALQDHDVVVLVGHGASVEALAIGFAGPDTPVKHVTYCSITDVVVDQDGRWTLGDHNCYTDHLSHPENIDHVRYK